MAKQGKVTAISMEDGTISIQNGNYTNMYSFTHPYVANSGRQMDRGAATFMREYPEVGDTVEYSYATDNGIQFLKLLKKVEGGITGGQPQLSNPVQSTPKYTTQNSTKKSYDSPEKQQMIYRQHAEKIITEFLSANPEYIDTKDGALSTEIASISIVTGKHKISLLSSE